MAIYSFEGKVPQIDQLAYVHDSANIIGDVVIGKECFIWSWSNNKGRLW